MEELPGAQNLEKTPSIVVGRVERFFNIGSIICQWEEMGGEGYEGGREGRRVSKIIS